MKHHLLLTALLVCIIFEGAVIHYMGTVIDLQRIEIRELFKLAFPEQ